jgi:hypothetical protein
MPFRKKIKEKAKAFFEKTRETHDGQGSSSAANARAKSDDDPEITGEGGIEVRLVT